MAISCLDFEVKCAGTIFVCVVLGLSSGALSIDESTALCQAVCSGSANSTLFGLLPQPHSSCNLTTVFRHRRLIEDKIVAKLGLIYKSYQKISSSKSCSKNIQIHQRRHGDKIDGFGASDCFSLANFIQPRT